MQLGINLGNVLDAPFEGAWAEPAKEYYFDDYLNQGFKSVRVPVRWDKHTSTAPPWKVDSKFMDRVEQIVGWSLKRGLRTVLNSHHDDWLDDAASDEDFQVQLSRLVAIWTQIAQRFASKSEELLAFEVYNEPHANMTLAWLNQMNAAVLPAIRATNPTRNVFFGGLKFMNPHWIVDQPDAMHFPANDSHVLLEVHSYDPYDFCGMTTGHITHSWARSDIDGWVDALAAWAARRQMPVLLGEFGCNKTQTNSSGRVGWYSHLRRAVESKGFAATVWDDSGSFTIYERSSRTWDADVLHALGLGARARASDHTAPAGRNEAVDAPRPAVASNVARPTVKVPGLGVVEGVTSAEYPSVDRFFAIPYAKSPVGELRWAPPEPHGPFRKSYLNGTAPGKVCIQPAKMSQRFDPSAPPVPYIQLPMGEDCLTLNIATPAARRGDGDGNATLLPVMVWFHGGGYSIGAGAHYRNDALVHASAGKVVVVTLNYRLGVFGFLGSSELAARTAARSGDRSTGNYGIDDQRLALRWVKAHIAAFGGDPDAVTIFGESAGGNSVVTHLVEPRSFGEDRLYSRAIIQSGTYPAAHTFEYAEATYGQVLKGTNCTNVQCLLGVDALDVAAAYPPGMVGPLVDGIALVDDPYSLLDAGEYNHRVPVLLGHNRDELAVWTCPLEQRATFSEADFDRLFRGVYNSTTMAQIKRLYADGAFPYPSDRGNQSYWWWAATMVKSDQFIGHCSARRVARDLVRGGTPAAYAYEFKHPAQRDATDGTNGWRLANAGFSVPGNTIAAHATEVVYSFGDALGVASGEEAALATVMRNELLLA